MFDTRHKLNGPGRHYLQSMASIVKAALLLKNQYLHVCLGWVTEK